MIEGREKMQQIWYKRNVFRTAFVAVLLAAIEIFIGNEGWVACHTLRLTYVPFRVNVARYIVYLVILGAVFFWVPIRRFLKKLDARFVSKCDVGALTHERTDYTKLFVILCLVFGLFFVFLTPPFNAPDEAGHFEQSYYVAHGQLLPRVDAQGNVYGMIDQGYKQFRETWPGGVFDINQKASYKDIFVTLQNTVDTTPVKIPYRYYFYPFLLYTPQAIGINVGHLLFYLFRMVHDYNTFQQMIFARLFNLLFFLVITACALKMIPVFKRTLLLLAMMPMTIFMAASCSADTFVYSISFLAVAYILRLAYSPDVRVIGKREFTCLSLLCGLLLLSKEIYVLLFLLCLLIPREKFRGIKRKLLVLVSSAVVGGALFGIWYLAVKISTKGMTPGSYYAWGAQGMEMVRSEALQTHYVLTHPLRYIAILYNDIVTQGGYLSSFIGRFGWLDTIVPSAFTVLYAVVLIISALMERSYNRLARWQRLLIFLIAAGAVALVQTSVYIDWTPHPNIGGLVVVGGIQVLGVQGRYFIPIALSALFLLANRFTAQFGTLGRVNAWFGRVTGALVVVSLNVSILYIALRYWIS